MYTLPTSVVANGREFNIRNRGDFRMVLDCFKALQDEELGEDLRVLASLIIFYNEFTCYTDLAALDETTVTELIKQMYAFFQCNQEKSPGMQTERSVIDWDKDSQIICAAINNVAKTEIRALEYLHWFTFMGYYTSIGESVLSTVVGIRYKIIKRRKLEKWEEEFKKDNPDYFVWDSSTIEEREVNAIIKEIWNQGGE